MPRPTASKLAGLAAHAKSLPASEKKDDVSNWPNYPQNYSGPAFVTGMTIDWDAEMTWLKGKGKADAVSVRFHYRVTGPNGPITFDGKTNTVAYDIAALPEETDKEKGGKQRTRAEIALRNIRGNIAKLLGKEEEEVNLFDADAGDLETAQLLIKGSADAGNPLPVMLGTSIRENTYTTKAGKVVKDYEGADYINELLSAG